ncbi:MAG: very short patch repair endonuclease [Candidatus Binataceae bacterium]
MAPTKVSTAPVKRRSRDVFTAAKRSEVMSHIRAKHTKPEIAVRRVLHALGYRFRLHDPKLPGRPDIILRKYHLIIEVNGCFWHRHHCLKGRMPVGNHRYWVRKLNTNKLRDRRNARRLRSLGWHVATIWECDVRRWTPARLREVLARVMRRCSAIQ